MNEKKSTSSTNTSNTNPTAHRALIITTVLVAAVLLGIGSLTGLAYASQQQTIVRNVSVGYYSVGGLKTLDAITTLENHWQAFKTNAFIFTAGDQQATIPIASPSSSGDDQEVVFALATFDAQAAGNAAYDYGHSGPLWQQVWQRVLGYIGQTHHLHAFALSSSGLRDALTKDFQNLAVEPVNATIALDANEVPTVQPSQPGTAVDYDAAIRQATLQLQAFNPTPIAITTTPVQPEIVDQPSLQTLANTQVPTVLAQAPITLTLDDQTWTIDRPQLADLVGFVQNGQTTSVGIDLQKTSDWLQILSDAIDVAPRDAKFNVVDGRVEEFQTSVVGQELNTLATAQAIQAHLTTHATEPVAVVVQALHPLTDTTSTNDLGIRELVAEGSTDFRGSPANRVYNIKLGAQKIHGLILQPGETFSLVNALGHIDQAHGWKPELVIKGSEITPEFGGGLCQVATTLFRAALNTGLPIVERRNHSLRVSYYEPPVGLDATIYEPKPDLRFTNDYSTALLLQTRIEGTKLIFSFYGTKDGRSVDLPTPTVYNRTPIPPTETHETTDLAPGQEECQNGHPGADATVTYTVTQADGTSAAQTFTSHYRALPKICRVGKSTTTES